MKDTKENSVQPVWNLADLLSRVDNDHELLRDLLDIFREDFPRTMQSLKAAIEDSNLKSTAALSHTLKGMLSNLGATAASAAASKIEASANAGESSSLRDCLDQLGREGESFRAEVETYLAGART